MKKQRSDNFNLSRNQPIHSHFTELLNSEREMILKRKLHFEQNTIHMLKSQLLKESINSNKWKFCGVQLKMKFDTQESFSMFSEIFEIKRRLLLINIYRLVFIDHVSYRLVHQALLELTMEQDIENQTSEFLSDPVIMVVHALKEHAIHNPFDFLQLNMLLEQIINYGNFTQLTSLTIK